MDEVRKKAEALLADDKLSDAVNLIKCAVDEMLKDGSVEKTKQDLEFLNEIRQKVNRVSVQAIATSEIKEEKRRSMAVKASPEKVKALLQYYLKQAASKEINVNADGSLKLKPESGAKPQQKPAPLEKQSHNKNLHRP